MKKSGFKKVLAVTLAGLAFAGSELAHAACTNASFAGRYSFFAHGSHVEIAPEPLPSVGTGVLKANGDGKMIGKVNSNLNGKPISYTFVGQYAVNPDCSGTASWNVTFSDGTPAPEPLVLSLAIAADGNEVYYAAMGHGVLVGTMKKQ